MGAQEFIVYQSGPTPQAAFQAARQRAQWEHGHTGYTGTVAEKHNITHIQRTPRRTAIQCARDILMADEGPGTDKFGPAGYILVSGRERKEYRDKYGLRRGEQVYLFYGLASC